MVFHGLVELGQCRLYRVCGPPRGGKPERPGQVLDSILVYIRDHVLILVSPVLTMNNNEDDGTTMRTLRSVCVGCCSASKQDSWIGILTYNRSILPARLSCAPQKVKKQTRDPMGLSVVIVHRDQISSPQHVAHMCVAQAENVK